MIKFENLEICGFEPAIRGMRNPMESWDKSDSGIRKNGKHFDYNIGDKDSELMLRLAVAGTDHRKFMRMITVYVDITAPLYWWKEFDTYKVGTVTNSCSTMHKLCDKEFMLKDFSVENIIDKESYSIFLVVFEHLESLRKKYLDTKDKKYWWQMIQLLPTSYNQKRTIMLNYEVLANIYKSRKNHKLDEWRAFCEWIRTLPKSEIITF